MSATLPIDTDTDTIGQPVRVTKTGELGQITQAFDFLGETYIEVTADDGRVLWPYTVHDVEPIHGPV